MARAPRTRAFSRSMIIATAVAAVGVLAVVSLGVRTQLDRDEDGDSAIVQESGAPRMVFAEFGLNEDQIYTAPADAPEDRTLHASVTHAPGWGINHGVAAAGPPVAYTLLPEDADSSPDAPAELW